MALSIVQKNATANDSVTSASGLSSGTLTAITAGNLIVVGFCHEGSPTTYTITMAGESFTQLTKRDHSVGDMSGVLFYVLSAAGGATTVNVKPAANKTFGRLYTWEFHADNAWALDQQALSAVGATGATWNSASFTPTGTGDGCAVAIGKEFTGGTVSAWKFETSTAATDHVEAAGTAQSSSWAFIKTSTISAGTATCTGPNAEYIVCAACFKANAAGGGTFYYSPQSFSTMGIQ